MNLCHKLRNGEAVNTTTDLRTPKPSTKEERYGNYAVEALFNAATVSQSDIKHK